MGWADEREQERRDEQERKREAARAKFDQWSKYLHLHKWGWGSDTFMRLHHATSDVQEFRRLSNYRGGDYEEQVLAVRLVADTLADQIQAAADGQDPATVAWVVAGLRCPSTPFCRGCASCQTVTSPLRPAEAHASGWF
jgi:hypothetical protein